MTSNALRCFCTCFTLYSRNTAKYNFLRLQQTALLRGSILLNHKMTSSGLQHYEVRLSTIALFLLLLIPGRTLTSVHKIAAVCKVHQDVIVDVDPGKHRYYPYMVKLPRCAGSVSLSNPSVKKCVPTASMAMSYKMYALPYFSPVTVNLDHHIRCAGECVQSSSSCNEFESWNSGTCYCDCKYKVSPSPSPCKHPLIWRQPTCSCACPSGPKTCPDEKEWSKETCMCSCKKRYFNRCERKRKFLNQENCKCTDLPLVNATAAARGNEMRYDGVQSKFVVVICIIECLLLVVIFVLIYRYCLKDPGPHNVDNECELCSFWPRKNGPYLQTGFPPNGCTVSNNSNNRIDDVNETSIESINKSGRLSNEQYDAQSSGNDSSLTSHSHVTRV